MNFDGYLRRRRLDPDAFRAADPARAALWAAWYADSHPDSFLLRIKQELNDIRRRYHLAEAPPPPPPAEGAAARPSGRRARPIGPLTEIPVLDPAVPLADPEVLRREGGEAPTQVPTTPSLAEAAPARPARPRAVIRRPVPADARPPASPSAPTQGAEADPASPPTATPTGEWQPATTASAVPDAPPVPPVTADQPGPDVPEATPGRPEADDTPPPPPSKPPRPRPIIRCSGA